MMISRRLSIYTCNSRTISTWNKPFALVDKRVAQLCKMNLCKMHLEEKSHLPPNVKKSSSELLGCIFVTLLVASWFFSKEEDASIDHAKISERIKNGESNFNLSKFSDDIWMTDDDEYFLRVKNNKELLYHVTKRLGVGRYGLVHEIEALATDKISRKACKFAYGVNNGLDYELQCLKYLHEQNSQGYVGIEAYPKVIRIDPNKQCKLKIMPKYEGCLHNLFHDRPVTPGEGMDMILQITQGISVLHEHKIAHMDLHRQNILYRNKNGSMRYDIVDFGRSHRYQPKSYWEVLSLLTEDRNAWCQNCILYDSKFNFDRKQYIDMMEYIVTTVGRRHFSEEFKNYLKETQERPTSNLSDCYSKLNKIQILVSEF